MWTTFFIFFGIALSTTQGIGVVRDSTFSYYIFSVSIQHGTGSSIYRFKRQNPSQQVETGTCGRDIIGCYVETLDKELQLLFEHDQYIPDSDPCLVYTCMVYKSCCLQN